MKEILLTNSSLVALVDDEDFALVSKYRWHLHSRGYVRTNQNPQIYLHHLVAGKPPRGLEHDHRNLDKRDCRKENIRLATRAQNNQNKVGPRVTKGVYVDKRRGTLHARIKHNKKTTFLGTFSTIDDAKKAYNEAAKRIFGEFARINL